MARTLDPTAHALRRHSFVDATQRLIGSKGYEQLSIGDVLADLGASKGAFYHYFDSKGALLEAVVERMTEAALESLAPIAVDPSLTAIEKLQGIFGGLGRWKSDRRELVLAVMQTWLSDDNAIVREKLRRGMVTRLAPLLAPIIRQGTAEGVFRTTSPDATARVLVSLMQGSSEIAGELYVARQAGAVTFEEVRNTLSAYTKAFERIVGMPAGSMALDESMLRPWFD
jgi:AcrR family transcriptional regulator